MPPQIVKLPNEPNPKNGHPPPIAQSTPPSDPRHHTDQNRRATMRIPTPCNTHQSNYNWGKIRAPGRYHGAAACARRLPLGSRAEVLEAMGNPDWSGLADELGDVMLQGSSCCKDLPQPRHTVRCSKRCQEDRAWHTPARSRSGLPTPTVPRTKFALCRHGASREAECYRDNCWIREAPRVLPRLARISQCCRVETTG